MLAPVEVVTNGWWQPAEAMTVVRNRAWVSTAGSDQWHICLAPGARERPGNEVFCSSIRGEDPTGSVGMKVSKDPRVRYCRGPASGARSGLR